MGTPGVGGSRAGAPPSPPPIRPGGESAVPPCPELAGLQLASGPPAGECGAHPAHSPEGAQPRATPDPQVPGAAGAGSLAPTLWSSEQDPGPIWPPRYRRLPAAVQPGQPLPPRPVLPPLPRQLRPPNGHVAQGTSLPPLAPGFPGRGGPTRALENPPGLGPPPKRPTPRVPSRWSRPQAQSLPGAGPQPQPGQSPHPWGHRPRQAQPPDRPTAAWCDGPPPPRTPHPQMATPRPALSACASGLGIHAGRYG